MVPRGAAVPTPALAGAHISPRVVPWGMEHSAQQGLPWAQPGSLLQGDVQSLPVPNTHLCSWKILLQRILKLSLPIQFRGSGSGVAIRPHNNNQMFQPGPAQGAPGEQPGCSHSPRADASSE